MNLLGNLLWVIFGGLLTAIEYFMAGIVLCVTIIGIPFGIQSFKMAGFALWPFGRKIVHKGLEDSIINTIFNIIWIFIGGIWIAITHIVFGVILMITIIGIPFGKKHFQLASLALVPFGKKIVNA